MFDKNQLVEMRWNAGTKAWYESKGYVFTKLNDLFYVNAEDLKPSSNKIIKVICDYCGKNFEKKFYALHKSRTCGIKDCCSDCRGKKKSERSLKERANEQFSKIEKICKEKGYKLITTIDEYVDVFMKIVYICPKHGIQKTELRILSMGCGCPECGKERISSSRKLSTDEVVNIIELNSKNKLLNPSDYIEYGVPNLIIKCECGNEYKTSLSSYIHWNVTRCPSCSQKESKSETHIKNFLNLHKINFKQENSFKDCKDINALPFDFYLPELNVCIEFNGRQHYEPVEHFGGYERFVVQQKHDKIKSEYCAKNNIKLVCIPYWDEDKIEEILVKQLNL